MQADGPISAERVVGQIKWFDPVRGFGFLADSAGGTDVLVHANVLRSFGQSSVSDGAVVEVRALATPRGRQAIEVVSIAPPPSQGHAPIADLVSVDLSRLDQLPLLPARVKWFDKAKGFGFANLFGRRGDVFLHVEVLRHWGFADLVPGEAVCLRVVDGPRGLMAAQLLAWERAVADCGAGGTGDGDGDGGTGGEGDGGPSDTDPGTDQGPPDGCCGGPGGCCGGDAAAGQGAAEAIGTALGAQTLAPAAHPDCCSEAMPLDALARIMAQAQRAGADHAAEAQARCPEHAAGVGLTALDRLRRLPRHPERGVADDRCAVHR